LKPLEQNVCMCSCSDTGSMQLQYTKPYQPHCISPNWGGGTLLQGAQNFSPVTT